MNALRTLSLLWLTLAYTLTLQAQYEGDLLFDETIVHEIRITVPATLDELRQIHSVNFLGDQPYTQGEVEIDGTFVDSVGVRVKGGFSASDPKKPLKLDFNEFVSSKKFDGLQKLNLQQGNMEESYIREAVSYNIMRLAGVKAPRTSFANVYFNDEYQGIYTLVEQIDDNFLKNRFASDKGTLYKTGAAGKDLGVKFENDHSLTFDDFEAMVSQTPDNILHEELPKYLNVESYFRYIAVNAFISARDSYIDVNYNHYVYYEPKSATYVHIPWDYNLALYGGGPYNLVPNTVANFLFNKTMTNPVLEERYLEIFCNLLDYNFDENRIQNLITQYVDLLAPHVPNDPFIAGIGDWGEGVDFVRTVISNNYNHFSSQMDANSFSCSPLTNPIPPNAIVINEIVASNDSLSNIEDLDGQSEDWIELYNNTNDFITLNNCYLSNDIDVLKHWRLPDNTIVPPNGYLIVWADRDIQQDGVHVDFKLKKSGGELYLSFENGDIIDQVSYSNQMTNVAWGRLPNGTGSFIQLVPTFNAMNSIITSTPISISSSNITNLSCHDSSDGAIEISVIGGTPPYTYLWSNSATTEDISNLTAGNYMLTITDSDEETASFSFDITAPSLLTLDVNCTNETFADQSDGTATTLVFGGTLPYTYVWNNNDVSPMLSGLAPGTYCVTVTDDNGCTSSACCTVNGVDCNITTNIIISDVSCHGENDGSLIVETQNAMPPLTYDWSSGGNTDTANNLSAGNYSVTVTDALGCQSIANANISEPMPLNLSLPNTPTILNCKVSEINLILDISGGTPPYTYNEPTIFTEAGTYTISVTDANNCTEQISVEISANLETPNGIANASGPLNCSGEDVILFTSGTTQFDNHTYTWYNANDSIVGTWRDIFITEPGTYTLEVMNINSCCASTSTVVVEDHFLTVNNAAFSTDCFGMNVIISGVDLNGSHPPFSYTWSTNTNNQIDFLVTDNLGCEATFGPVELVVLETPNVTAMITNPTSTGNDGAIDLDVTGGTMPYTFVWDNGATTEDLTNLPAGDYSVTITDANGCQQNYTYTLDINTAIANLELANQIDLLPNPSQGWVTLSIDDYTNEKIQIDIFNTNGQKIKDYRNIRLPNQKYLMDWQDLVDGLYFVKITFANKVITKKILLTK